MKKILVTDYASFIESRNFSEIKIVYQLKDADIIVNPNYGAVLNKLIIINIPIEIPLDSLLDNNTVISRFPIGYGIPVIPFNLPEIKKSKDKDYSCLILTKYLLSDIKYLKLVKENKFLVGINEVIDGDATLIGLEILSSGIKS